MFEAQIIEFDVAIKLNGEVITLFLKLSAFWAKIRPVVALLTILKYRTPKNPANSFSNFFK